MRNTSTSSKPPSRAEIITTRKHLCITQAQLGEALGLRQPSVAAFENGTRNWPQERLEQAMAWMLSKRERDRECMRQILLGLEESGWFAAWGCAS